MPPPTPKFLQNVVSDDPQLNRVQNNVAEALRHLQNSVTLQIEEAIAALPAGAADTIPFYFFAPGLQNATRFMGPDYPAAPWTTDEWQPIPVDGTIKSLQVKLTTVPMSNAALATLTFTLRVTPAFTAAPAQVDTTFVIAFTGPLHGNTYAYGISLGSWPVVKGDLLSIKLLDVSYGSAGGHMAATVLMEKT